jgi:putative transposase
VSTSSIRSTGGSGASTVEFVGRPLRVLDPDATYHVVSRGNNGEPIVWDALDRRMFRMRLDRIASTFQLEFMAWCLMTTHVHFVVRSPDLQLSAAMQELLGGHARMMNRRHGRTGHLFQNRFFSVEVATDAHLISSIAYVNRNPFAAFLVEDPADWRDSSYRATMGLEPAPRWLELEFVLGVFGRTANSARRELAGLVRSGRVPVSDTVEAVRQFETRGALPSTGALAA